MKKKRIPKVIKKGKKRDNTVLLVIGGAILAAIAVLVITTMINQSKLRVREVQDLERLNSIEISE